MHYYGKTFIGGNEINSDMNSDEEVYDEKLLCKDGRGPIYPEEKEANE